LRLEPAEIPVGLALNALTAHRITAMRQVTPVEPEQAVQVEVTFLT
jgi:hypothetical protein